MQLTSFPPVVSAGAKVLILGSMPGQESLACGQYYANARNTFWFIMGEICGARTELPYAERKDRLMRAGIALWDTLMHCEREGSLDKKIKNEVPNDFATFFTQYPTIKAIYFNGQKAEKSFKQHVNLSPTLHSQLTFTLLPSTSPAHTLAKEVKVQQWRAIETYL